MTSYRGNYSFLGKAHNAYQLSQTFYNNSALSKYEAEFKAKYEKSKEDLLSELKKTLEDRLMLSEVNNVLKVIEDNKGKIETDRVKAEEEAQKKLKVTMDKIVEAEEKLKKMEEKLETNQRTLENFSNLTELISATIKPLKRAFPSFPRFPYKEPNQREEAAFLYQGDNYKFNTCEGAELDYKDAKAVEPKPLDDVMAATKHATPATPANAKPVTPANAKPVTPANAKPVTPVNTTTKPVTPANTTNTAKPVTVSNSEMDEKSIKEEPVKELLSKVDDGELENYTIFDGYMATGDARMNNRSRSSRADGVFDFIRGDLPVCMDTSQTGPSQQILLNGESNEVKEHIERQCYERIARLMKKFGPISN
jgi:hypothetical protein